MSVKTGFLNGKPGVWNYILRSFSLFNYTTTKEPEK